MVDKERRKLFGERLTAAMNKKQWTPIDIKKRSKDKISYGNMHFWMRGLVLPSHDKLCLLAKILGVDVGYLLGDQEK
jgi:transcriptional regulator with XRE-family HTH domain